MLRLSDDTSITLDVADWMRGTGRFNDIRATEREWIGATCPYHDDRHASFAVNADHGGFVCQACGAKGRFVNLVRHVEGHASTWEAETSLLARFGRYVPSVDETIALDFDDVKEETFVSEIPSNYVDNSNWLRQRRGIEFDTQAMYNVHSSPTSVVFPWCDEKGRVVTFKHRSISDKSFWYEPSVPSGRLKSLLFGLIQAQNSTIIVICEGEIDALSVAQTGYCAVALGGSNFSERQASLLKNSACDEVVVFTDNDEAGRKVRGIIVDKLVGHKRVSVINQSMLGPTWKDANDVLIRHGVDGITKLIEHRIPVGLSLDFGK
jgi:DNA primase